MKTKINLLGYYLFKLIWGLKYASLSWLQIIKKKKKCMKHNSTLVPGVSIISSSPLCKLDQAVE